ncbi:MAG: Threonine aldolase [Chloroflexi bacterium]|jgi:threonine aldolase|nr:Threonine aldolase [Chloroflexota bacterium]
MIDLRSDTVTRPTEAMRKAMAQAEVGDDVYEEDPTINRLQELAAELMGKEAALFVPTGTMGNLVALLAHCERGQEILLGDNSHVFYYEVGGASVVGGLAFHTLPNDRFGMIDPAMVAGAIRTPDIHFAQTGLLCLENTHNRAGGTVLSKEQIDQLCQVAHDRDVPVHLDGARIFNAASFLELPVAQLVENLDSVQFCLSKGLAAPAGSIVVGNRNFIAKARKMRKMLGGGMRQAGVLAAAGIIALTEMTQRLEEDHYNARRFAQSLAWIDGFDLDLETVQTNIVAVNLNEKTGTAAEWVAKLKDNGILAGAAGPRRLRFVFHNDVDRAGLEKALSTISNLAS